MKRFCLILFTLISFPVYVNASIIPANEEGIVIVPKNKSSDLKEHNLVSIQNDAAASIQNLNGATTFSTMNYRDGYFDSTTSSMYTVSDVNVIDNNISTNTIIDRNKVFTAKFYESIDLKGFYIRSGNIKDTVIKFYNAGVLIKSIDGLTNEYNLYKIEDVDEIKISTKRLSIYFHEFELFVGTEIDYIATSNLKVYDIEETTANVSFTAPESKYYKESEVLIDGKSFYRGTDTDIHLENLKSNTTYEVIIRSYYTDGVYVDTKTTFRTAKDTIPPKNVLNLTARQVGDTIVLNWTNPADKDFSHVLISQNGMVKESNVKSESYIDRNPLNGDNNYRVVAVDENNNFSSGEYVKVKFVGTEVSSLQVKAANHEKVELKWENPQRPDFEEVIISRKNANASFFGDDGYTDLFQTNGTIFNDLTVSPDTEYTYRLRTVIKESESKGVTVNVKTPKMAVSGGGTDVDDDGNYVVKWKSPVTGKIKVLIAGVEYKTVPAADKQIIIPKEKMKFDLLGMPDVQLIPIDDDGNPGIPSKPGGGGNGGGIGDIVGGGDAADILNPDNVLDAGVKLLGVVGLFLLLGLSFVVVPKLIRTIRLAIDSKKSTKIEVTGRRINE